MTIGIMQPYIFPYIGYFQLIRAVDKFVIYDDVNFINKGWINRNRILVSGEAHLFTIPLKDASQNKLIREVELARDTSWKKKFLKTLQQSYQKAPNYPKVFPLLEEIVHLEAETIAELTVYALIKLCNYMDLKTEIIPSSSVYNNTSLKAQERILDICRQENATGYINAIGGMELYDKQKFGEAGIRLEFIKSLPVSYPQFKNAFVPWLSVIDILMFNEQENITRFLDQYELL
ncbi:hypothetical protein DYBT9275_03369 [Dyadobacter sp. CECT 9275]|uniref:WbqC-like protein family protein n=1 Tax=Dyadobacter helix TaxID=2822344 RepID=A0A916N6M7_9BACT|nr:WbqC family protein [Dyadobacter sp. CECT 9275]CAG5004430.1 hypothetical protein DYBT9275_03369 [Dyadobacter sp. CECT 9275]